MTLNECKKLCKKDSAFNSFYWTNYYNALARNKSLIQKMKSERPGVSIHLHHVNIGCDNYE